MGLTFRDCEPADPLVGGSWGGSSRTVSSDSLDWEGSGGALLERLGGTHPSLTDSVVHRGPACSTEKGQLRSGAPDCGFRGNLGKSPGSFISGLSPTTYGSSVAALPALLLRDGAAWYAVLSWTVPGYEPNMAGGDRRIRHAGAGASA